MSILALETLLVMLKAVMGKDVWLPFDTLIIISEVKDKWSKAGAGGF
jgi:hypothetical protein